MAYIQVQSGTAGTLLPASRQSPRAARVFVSERLREWHREAIAESAVLLVSELVTNAVVHAQTPAQLEVRWFDHTVRVAVTDGMSDGVEPDDASLPAPIGAPAGRGLRIIEALADRWGVSVQGMGKTVWFELRVPDRAERRE